MSEREVGLSLAGCARLADVSKIEGNESGIWDAQGLMEIAIVTLSRGYAAEWMRQAFGEAELSQKLGGTVKQRGWEFRQGDVRVRCWCSPGREPSWALVQETRESGVTVEVGTEVARVMLRVGAALASRSPGCQRVLLDEGSQDLLGRLRAWEERSALREASGESKRPGAGPRRM